MRIQLCNKLMTLLFVMLCMPMAASAAESVTISSKSQWKSFVSQKSGKEVDVKLACDLTLSDGDDMMGEFVGTFDGQGHTVTLNFKENSGDFAMFEYASGKVKNLNFAGYMLIKMGLTSYTERSPLARKVAKDLEVENCHSSVYLDVDGSDYFDNSAYTGGFICQTYKDCTVTFKDCSFTGTFGTSDVWTWTPTPPCLILPSHEYGYILDTGGFVGRIDEKTEVKFTNCLSSPMIVDTEEEFSIDSSVGFFIGSHSGSYTDLKITATNTFGHLRVPNSDSKVTADNLGKYGATVITDDVLVSGETSFKLSAGRLGDDNPWAQTIGTDSFPQLKTFAPSSKEVYLSDATRQVEPNAWTTLFYPANYTLPDGVEAYVVRAAGTQDSVVLNIYNSSTHANVPLVIHNTTANKQTISFTPTYYNAPSTSGYLHATHHTTPVTDSMYLLDTNDAGSPVFRKATSTSTKTLPTGRCYLQDGASTAQSRGVRYSNVDVVVISSKQQWTDFVKKYDGYLVDATLNCDITLDNDDPLMEKLNGVFDGNGHTITVNYQSEDKTLRAPFMCPRGTIKNLHLTGDIYYTLAYECNSYPLAYSVESTGVNDYPVLNIENCHSDVTYRCNGGTSGGNFFGFVGYVYARCTVNFKDCSSRCKVVTDDVSNLAGFVEFQGYNSHVNFTNCVADMSECTSTSGSNVDVFLGRQYNNKCDASATNCYARTNTAGLSFDNKLGVTIVSDEMESGEVAYKLNAGRDGDDAVWLQTLGTDKAPVLRTFSPESKEVFYTKGEERAASSSKWATLFYPKAVTLPDNVTAYVAQMVSGSTLYVSESLSSPAASQPLLLYCADGMPAITLPALYYNDRVSTESALLTGVYDDTEPPTDSRVLTETDGEATFVTSAETVGATHCYLNAANQDAYKIAVDGVVIRSKDEWNTFKTKYNGKTVNARLDCDLTLNETDYGMELYSGTFDGNGHTISINYVSANDDKLNAPFITAAGTIKNLKIEGNIKLTWDGLTAQNYAAPLVNKVVAKDTELTIDNCHSNVTIEGSGEMTEKPGNRVGGFVRLIGGSSEEGIAVHFNDCSATITVKNMNSMFNYGGFVGHIYEGNTVTFDNCYADVKDNSLTTYQAGLEDASLCDYFVTASRRTTVTATNCFARKATFADKDFYNTAGVTIVSDDQLESGEVTSKLNNGRTGDGAAWLQTIGTDTAPEPRLVSANSLEVFSEPAAQYSLTDAGWGTLFYPTDVKLADGVKAYTTSVVEGDVVVLTSIEEEAKGYVPANVPVILCSLEDGSASPSEITIPLVAAYHNRLGGAVMGLLHGVYESTAAPNGSYVLQKHGDNVAFYEVDTSVSEPYVPAWRCYLDVPAGQTQSYAKYILRLDDDEPTAVDNAAITLEPLLRDGAVYDLSGRKVQTVQKNQVYIKNGRKFIIR